MHQVTVLHRFSHDSCAAKRSESTTEQYDKGRLIASNGVHILRDFVSLKNPAKDRLENCSAGKREEIDQADRGAGDLYCEC